MKNSSPYFKTLPSCVWQFGDTILNVFRKKASPPLPRVTSHLEFIVWTFFKTSLFKDIDKTGELLKSSSQIGISQASNWTEEPNLMKSLTSDNSTVLRKVDENFWIFWIKSWPFALLSRNSWISCWKNENQMSFIHNYYVVINLNCTSSANLFSCQFPTLTLNQNRCSIFVGLSSSSKNDKLSILSEINWKKFKNCRSKVITKTRQEISMGA